MRRAGVVGYPLGHSLSPAFQQAAFDAAGLLVRYERYETPPEELAGFVRDLREDEWLGVNVTIPHKTAVIPLLDELSPGARAIGAVNTVVHSAAKLTGHNTDAAGFRRALEESGYDASGATAVVLGSGGAARAVVAALVEGGASRVTVAARRPDRARVLVEELRVVTADAKLEAAAWEGEQVVELVREAGLLVNTTPVGMAGGPAEPECPLPARALHRRLTVFDTVYNPPLTPLLRACRLAGARTIGGLDMLVYQGAESFRLWTGLEPPVEVMWRAAREALEKL